MRSVVPFGSGSQGTAPASRPTQTSHGPVVPILDDFQAGRRAASSLCPSRRALARVSDGEQVALEHQPWCGVSHGPPSGRCPGVPRPVERLCLAVRQCVHSSPVPRLGRCRSHRGRSHVPGRADRGQTRSDAQPQLPVALRPHVPAAPEHAWLGRPAHQPMPARFRLGSNGFLPAGEARPPAHDDVRHACDSRRARRAR
jgi:hypothetical protein